MGEKGEFAGTLQMQGQENPSIAPFRVSDTTRIVENDDGFADFANAVEKKGFSCSCRISPGFAGED